MRGFGEIEALRTLLPDAAIPVFALLTQLGDVWFVFVVLTLLYWGDGRLPAVGLPRSRAVFVLALALCALALTGGLKALFAFPRPPTPGDVTGLRYVPVPLEGMYVAAASADGYGFPSGHAIITTVVWGALALVLDAGTRGQRALVAGVVVALVALARVALGVHYAVDVLAGVAVGLALLAVGMGLARRRARQTFWLAVALAAVGVFVGPVIFDDAATLGATLGGAVTWETLGDVVPEYTTGQGYGVLLAALGVVVLGGLFVVVYALNPSLVVTTLASAAVIAGMLVLPLAFDGTNTRAPSTGTR